MTIEEIYQKQCATENDIFQHLPVLRKYAEDCEIITELGVRSIVSTWAFLAAKPKVLISIDIHHPSHYKEYDPDGCNLQLVHDLAKQQGTAFVFLQQDSRIALPPADMVFFDTNHTYDQLCAELNTHGFVTKKYLAFHDTVSCGLALWPAINEFLRATNDWEVAEQLENNNGLLILKRKP